MIRLLRGLLMTSIGVVTMGGSSMAQQVATQGAATPVVVELFTSQGCSSCPPADQVLKELIQRPDVIALSFHVDYWDYIGWKDPFSDPRYTRRQRDYGAAMELRSIYTPQMVINGRYDVVGSYEDQVMEMIEQAKGDAGRVMVALAQDKPGTLSIQLPNAAEGGKFDGRVLAVFYDAEHVTPVKRGENAGATLTDVHVVRDLRELGRYDGGAQNLTLDYQDALTNGYAGIAILVQQGRGGPIIGAAAVTLDNS